MPSLYYVYAKLSNDLAGDHTRTISVAAPTTGGLMKFAVKKATCLGCKVPLKSNSLHILNELDNSAVCEHCVDKFPELLCRQIDSVKKLEVQFNSLWTQCQRCQGSLHQDVIWYAFCFSANI